MESKYYTPSVNEFHIGFEYEINDCAKEFAPGALKDKDLWHKQTFGDEFVSFLGTSDSIKLSARVKYLDQSDAESLGWEYVPFLPKGDMDCKWFEEFNIGNFRLCFWGDLGKRWKDLDWIQNEDQIWSYQAVIEHKDKTLFNGIIKNKSELKKLMQQLGIK